MKGQEICAEKTCCYESSNLLATEMDYFILGAIKVIKVSGIYYIYDFVIRINTNDKQIFPNLPPLQKTMEEHFVLVDYRYSNEGYGIMSVINKDTNKIVSTLNIREICEPDRMTKIREDEENIFILTEDSFMTTHENFTDNILLSWNYVWKYDFETQTIFHHYTEKRNISDFVIFPGSLMVMNEESSDEVCVIDLERKGVCLQKWKNTIPDFWWLGYASPNLVLCGDCHDGVEIRSIVTGEIIYKLDSLMKLGRFLSNEHLLLSTIKSDVREGEGYDRLTALLPKDLSIDANDLPDSPILNRGRMLRIKNKIITQSKYFHPQRLLLIIAATDIQFWRVTEDESLILSRKFPTPPGFVGGNLQDKIIGPLTSTGDGCYLIGKETVYYFDFSSTITTLCKTNNHGGNYRKIFVPLPPLTSLTRIYLPLLISAGIYQDVAKIIISYLGSRGLMVSRELLE